LAPPDLPESVAWLARQLESKGWTLVSDETHPESFGDRIVVYRRRPVTLRLIRDRSQWSVDLKVAGWRESRRVQFPLFDGFGI
jgi:hypothetical protein